MATPQENLVDPDFEAIVAKATGTPAPPTTSKPRTPTKPRNNAEHIAKIREINPDFADTAEGFIAHAQKNGLNDVVIKSGYRTAEQQNALYRNPRTRSRTMGNDGYIKESPHQQGRAIDWTTQNPANKPKLHALIRDYAQANGLQIPRNEPWHMGGPPADEDFERVVSKAKPTATPASEASGDEDFERIVSKATAKGEQEVSKEAGQMPTPSPATASPTPEAPATLPTDPVAAAQQLQKEQEPQPDTIEKVTTSRPKEVPVESIPDARKPKTFDPYTPEGRETRDIQRRATETPGQIAFDVSLPEGAKSWADVDSSTAAMHGIKQWARAQGIPEDYVDKWTKEKFGGQLPTLARSPTEEVARGNYDEVKRSIKLGFDNSTLQSLKDDYQKQRGILGKTLDYVTDPTATPGEKFAAPVELAGETAVRTAIGALEGANRAWWAGGLDPDVPSTEREQASAEAFRSGLAGEEAPEGSYPLKEAASYVASKIPESPLYGPQVGQFQRWAIPEAVGAVTDPTNVLLGAVGHGAKEAFTGSEALAREFGRPTFAKGAEEMFGREMIPRGTGELAAYTREGPQEVISEGRSIEPTPSQTPAERAPTPPARVDTTPTRPVEQGQEGAVPASTSAPESATRTRATERPTDTERGHPTDIPDRRDVSRMETPSVKGQEGPTPTGPVDTASAPSSASNRVTEALRTLPREATGAVRIADVHAALPDLDPEEINQILKSEHMADLQPIDDPRALTEADRANPVDIAGSKRHLIYPREAQGDIETMHDPFWDATPEERAQHARELEAEHEPIHHANYMEHNEDGTFKDAPNKPKFPLGDPRAEPEPSMISARKADMSADRAELDLPELPDAERKGWQTTLDNARAKNLDRAATATAEDVLRKPRPLNDEETAGLVLRAQQVKNEHLGFMREIREEADPDKLAELRASVELREKEFGTLSNALRKSGTEKGRALVSQKLTINQDYDLMSLLDRAKAKGIEITPSRRARYETMAQTIEDLQKQLVEHESKAAEEELAQTTKLAVKQMGRDAAREARKVASTAKRSALDDEAAVIKQQIAAAWARVQKKSPGIQPMMGLGKLDPEGEITKLVIKLAKNRLRANIALPAEDLARAVHAMVKEHIEDISERDIRTMISSYGKTIRMSQDPVDVKFRETKQLLADVNAIEDIQAGKRPPKRGLQYDKPSQLVRESRARVQAAMKEYGIEIEKTPRSSEDEMKSALDRAKAATKNRIEDLNKWIKDGKRTVANKTEVIPDEELKGLRAEKERLENVWKDIEGPKVRTDDEKIKMAQDAVQKSIADYEERIKTGQIGPQRRTVQPWSEELGKLQRRRAELQNQMGELRKAQAKANKPPSDPEQIAIDRQVKSTQKSIDGITERLRTGNIEARRQIVAPWSEELGKLKQQRVELQKQLNEARKAARPGADPDKVAQRNIENSLKATNKSIANIEQKIKSGNIETVPREGAQSAWSPEIGAARKHRDTLNKILADMRRDAAKVPKTDAEISASRELAANKALKTRLEKTAADLERRIRERDFSKPAKRSGIIYDAESNRLKTRVESLKKQYEQDLRANQKKTIGDYLVRWKRFAVLTYPTTFGKLAAAAAGKMVLSPIEEGIGYAESKLPLIRTISKQATTEAGASSLKDLATQEARAVTQMWRGGAQNGFRETLRYLKTGDDMLDLLYGGKDAAGAEMGVADKVLGAPGRAHGAIKEIPKRAEFYRSFEKLLAKAGRAGHDLADPATQLQAAMEAYPAAKRAILQQPNFVSNAFADAMRGMEQRGGRVGKIAANIARFEVPITRVPVNFVGEVLNYTYGLPRAIAETTWRKFISHSLDKLTPEQANSLMRSWKKGTVGLAPVLLGFYLPDTFGGYYQPGEKRGPNEPRAGEMMVGGYRIPRWMGHIPPLEAAQFGATVRRIWDAINKKGGEGSGLAGLRAGVTAGVAGQAKEVPFLDPLIDAKRGLGGILGRPQDQNLAIGGQIRSVIPGAAQWAARKMDETPTGDTRRRKLTTVGQVVKEGIPGYRETIPISDVFGTKASKGSDEVQRLNITMRGATPKPDETPEDFKQRQTLVNPAIKKAVDTAVSRDYLFKSKTVPYDELPDEEKEYQIKQAHKDALEEIEMPEKPEKPEPEHAEPIIQKAPETRPRFAQRNQFAPPKGASLLRY